jgi:Tol biopolymer transport system component
MPQSWNNAAPTWSPDSSQIAFLTDRTGRWEIWVMNADGSNQHPLVTAEMLDGVTLQYNGMDERVLSWR